MLSVFVLVDRTVLPHDDAHRARVVVRTLAALVNLVVSDVVADATLVTRVDPALVGIDDQAGCTIVERATLGEAFTHALPTARRPHTLVLRAGFAPDQTAATEIIETLGSGHAEGSALLMRATALTALQRLVPNLAPAVGLIAPVATLRSVPISGDQVLRAFARALPARTMRARAAALP